MLISEQIYAYCSNMGRLSTAVRGDVPKGGVLGVGAVSAAERFELLLRGRKPYTWAQTVALSRGAIHRLQNGSFPDPAKLVPACRVENISLSWWLDGIGAPYIVYIAQSPLDHAAIGRELFAEDPHGITPVIVGDEKANHFVFIIDAEGVSDGTTYSYRAVTIIGGASADASTFRALEAMPHFEDQLQLIYLDDDDMRDRLATGRMGSHEFLELFDAAAHPFDASNPNNKHLRAFASPGRRVAEPMPIKYELLAQIESLEPGEAEIVSRMIKGLRPK